ncbi:hypothetical protein MASR1M101_03950 [Gemmatimonas sp.]
MTTGMPTLPEPVSPPPRFRSGLLAVAILLLVGGGAGAAWWQTQDQAPAARDDGMAKPAALSDSSARAPAGDRVRVRVLNTSGVSGLARRATIHLRTYGFDVVDFGSGRTDTNALTRISVHTGHDDWAERAKRALGAGVIAADPDTSRYVDLTIFVGRDWRPSTETLRP